MRYLVTIGLLSLLMLSPGCFENKMEITLNPDGSGKATMDNYMTLPPQMTAGSEKPDMKEMAKGALQQTVTNSQGVDAWADLSSEVTEDGRIHMKGMAYFPDITKFRIQGDNSQVKWTVKGTAGTLEFVLQEQKPAGAEPKKMTQEEIDSAVKATRAQWKQSKPMMEMVLGKMKIDTTYILPGKLGTVEGFNKTEKGAQMLLEGKKLLAYMDKVMADDKLMAEMVKSGRNPMKDGPGEKAMMEGIFGKGVTCFKASATDMKPQFAYKPEMTKAKEAQGAMMKKLGIDATAPKATIFGPPATPQKGSDTDSGGGGESD